MAPPSGTAPATPAARPAVAVVVTVVAVVAGTAVAVLVATLVPWPGGAPVASATGRGLLAGLVVATAVAVVAVGLLVVRRSGSEAAAHLLVGGTALLLATASVLALAGTRWGFGGLYADASFRTEAATRYADSARLADYAYAGLPPYYPPALSWLQGRAAALTDLPGWMLLQPFQVVLAATVPLVAFLLWRRVAPPLVAAGIVAAGSLLTVDLLKPDEWLVLMCATPWWLDLVRGVRADGVRAWPWWAHGVFGGAVLLVHTFYLLPLAVATVLGWVVDLARRRRPELGVVRALGVVGVGLVVATPYWVPVLRARLSGMTTDSLQMRYTYPGANVPPWPFPFDLGPSSVLGAVGVAWFAWSALEARRGRPRPLAGALLLVLLGAWTTMLAGAVGVHLGVGFLAFKADEMVILAMVASGVCGLVELLARAVRPVRSAAHGRTLRAAGLALVLGVTGYAAGQYAGHWVVGQPVLAAQTTRYPDGTSPAAAESLEPVSGPAWVTPGGPSVAQVEEAWRDLTGTSLDSDTVVLSTRVDLTATTPVHPFVTGKSIYSNPLGRFAGRYALLRELERCGTPACAHALLRDNPYDAVDGIVLERVGDELVMPILVDDFPERSRTTAVRVPLAVVTGPGFASTEVDGVVVVALTGPG
ncbi:arabinofuranosyltransferase [Nocardioides sp. CFH 31398]|uniref:arabinofuranosyltransferase n=1 Tax=Nocardioides sp. CFH 31398 TaxID=2919579 RepID=UPI001F061D33|nr:arabinofuranosyltransferase [Nocardioides sp. CFH 31398]MCH1868800.1 galactan 5-O-arabinofuranosyltransferase [Nocardioides sp. CFH 31398]